MVVSLNQNIKLTLLLVGSSSKIMYRDLQQIHEYQKHYEHLVSLRINKLLFELLPPFLKHLKSISADSGLENWIFVNFYEWSFNWAFPSFRKYRQTYRSIYSLVCSNGRTLPAIVGNLNDDFFEVNDCWCKYIRDWFVFESNKVLEGSTVCLNLAVTKIA